MKIKIENGLIGATGTELEIPCLYQDIYTLQDDKSHLYVAVIFEDEMCKYDIYQENKDKFEIYCEAGELNWYIICYYIDAFINEEIKECEFIASAKKELIENFGIFIMNDEGLNIPSAKIQIEIFNADVDCFKFISNPTNELFRTALEYSSHFIFEIDNPSEELQELAIDIACKEWTNREFDYKDLEAIINECPERDKFLHKYMHIDNLYWLRFFKNIPKDAQEKAIIIGRELVVDGIWEEEFIESCVIRYCPDYDELNKLI